MSNYPQVVLNAIVRLCLFFVLLVSIVSRVQAESAFQTAALQDIALHPKRNAPATVLSLNHSVLSAQIQAKVKTIQVGVSESVKKGQMLLELDCTDFDLTLKMTNEKLTVAHARLTLAQSQKERSSRLLAKQVSSQEEADRAEVEEVARKAELEETRIALQKAKIDVSRCQISAPFAGVITARSIGEGQLASVGTPLISIVETDRLELSAKVKPDDVMQIADAKELYFRSGEKYPVQVNRLGGVINSESRNQEIRLVFTGTAPRVGTAGKLYWRDPDVFVSSDYVVQRNKTWGIFISKNKKAVFYPLTEAVPGRPARITLPEATHIVVSGLGKIKDGDEL